MPTDEERREYPHLSDAEWAGIERLRARKREMEEEWARNPPSPGFEELVLEQLREQTALLREIRDRLARSEAGGNGA